MWQLLLVCLLVIISIFELTLLYLAQCVFCHCPWSLVHYYFDQMQPHHKYILGCTWFVVTNCFHFFNSLTSRFYHISSALGNVHLKTWQCANACKSWQCDYMAMGKLESLGMCTLKLCYVDLSICMCELGELGNVRLISWKTWNCALENLTLWNYQLGNMQIWKTWPCASLANLTIMCICKLGNLTMWT